MVPLGGPVEERQPAQRPADEVEQRVRRRRHDPGGPRIAEPPFDRRLLAKRRAPAHRKGQIGRFGGASPAAAFTSSTRSLASARPCWMPRRCRRPVLGCGRSRSAAGPAAPRGIGCWASVWPRCSRRVCCRCVAGLLGERPASARRSPTALSTRKYGSTAVSATSSPPPSAPSIADPRHRDTGRGHRRRPVAAQPQAVERRRRLESGRVGTARTRASSALGGRGRVCWTRRSCRPPQRRSPSSCGRRAGRRRLPAWRCSAAPRSGCASRTRRRPGWSDAGRRRSRSARSARSVATSAAVAL